jgi:hypothetical protein
MISWASYPPLLVCPYLQELLRADLISTSTVDVIESHVMSLIYIQSNILPTRPPCGCARAAPGRRRWPPRNLRPAPLPHPPPPAPSPGKALAARRRRMFPHARDLVRWRRRPHILVKVGDGG